MTNYHPRNDLVLILPDQSATHHGVIALPPSAQQIPTIGTVAAVGPGVLLDDGNRIPLDLSVGDRVRFTPDNARPHFDVDGEQHLLMHEREVLCTLSGEPVGVMMMPTEPDADKPPTQTINAPGIPAASSVGSPG